MRTPACAATTGLACSATPVPAARRPLTHDPLTSDQWSGLLGLDAVRVGERTVLNRPDNFLEQVVFDRGGNKYHGRVAAIADGAREGGLSL